MNEPQKRKAYDYETDGMAELEQRRKQRLAHRKQRQRQRRNRRLLLCAFVLLIAASVFALIFPARDTRPFKGAWAYGEAATIQFSGRDSGMITLFDTEYPFTYTVEKNALHLHFDNAYISDASYTFTVEDGTLTLSGGEGTTGGTYALTKTPEPGREDK